MNLLYDPALNCKIIVMEGNKMESDFKEIFKNNLIREIKKAGLTQIELAKKVGVSASTVSDWVTGKKIPRISKIDKLSAIFGVERKFLLGDSFSEDSFSPQGCEYVRIPVFETVTGIPLKTKDFVIGYEVIPQAMAQYGDHFALKIKDQSMEPVLSEGDVIIVQKQSDVDSGEIAIVLVDNEEATVKRVKKSPIGITLIGDNASVYQPHFYTNDQIKTIPIWIIGKVVEQRRRF